MITIHLPKQLFMDDSELATFQQNTLEWLDAGGIEADPALLPMLRYFNNLPGVATRFSCEGHPGSAWDSFYVMFYTTGRGYEQLARFFAAYAQNVATPVIDALREYSTACLDRFPKLRGRPRNELVHLEQMPDDYRAVLLELLEQYPLAKLNPYGHEFGFKTKSRFRSYGFLDEIMQPLLVLSSPTTSAAEYTWVHKALQLTLEQLSPPVQ